jgi:hypothetical protein
MCLKYKIILKFIILNIVFFFKDEWLFNCELNILCNLSFNYIICIYI